MHNHEMPILIKSAAIGGILKYLAKPLLSKSTGLLGLGWKLQYGKSLLDAPKVFKKMPSIVGKLPKVKRLI